MPMPAKPVADGGTNEHTGPEGRRRAVIVGVRRRVYISVRHRIDHNNRCWVVTRHVDNIRTGRFYLDDLLFLDDDRLLSGLKISRRVGLVSKLLDGIHDTLLLI